MEVILLQKVANLGNIGDKVKVKPGYGRNFLLPSGRAALRLGEPSLTSRRRVPMGRLTGLLIGLITSTRRQLSQS